MERLRTLSEDECYMRCYGWRGSEESVKVLRPTASSPTAASLQADLRAEGSEAGERLRMLLELRLDARESFEAA